MAKMWPRYRIFGDRRYSLHSHYSTRAEALKEAKRLRQLGNKARVSTGQWKARKVYQVWARQ